jgi:hypothetical protein
VLYKASLNNNLLIAPLLTMAAMVAGNIKPSTSIRAMVPIKSQHTNTQQKMELARKPQALTSQLATSTLLQTTQLP